jgi:hypothetical protein
MDEQRIEAIAEKWWVIAGQIVQWIVVRGQKKLHYDMLVMSVKNAIREALSSQEEELRTVREERDRLRSRLDSTSEEFGCVPVSFASLCEGIDSRHLRARVEELVIWHIRKRESAEAELQRLRGLA